MSTTTPFGQRIAAIRRSLGIAQGQVTGVSQPHLSKIENGREKASVKNIDLIAKAFDRNPVELARGTDREGYYLAQRLKPEEREEFAQQQSFREAMALEYLYRFYARVCELFDALYAGVVVPAFRAEEAYIGLVVNCKKAITAVESFIPDFGAGIYSRITLSQRTLTTTC